MLFGTPITHESTPDYDGWGWDSYWSAQQWIDWHKALSAQYGITQANNLFKEAWFEQGIWEHGYNWYKYNKEFVAYFKSQGVNVGNTISNFLVSTTTAIDNIVDGAGNVIDNTTGAASNLTNTAGKILPALLTIAGLGIAYIFYRAAKDGSLEDIKKLTPAGVLKK